MKILYKTIFLIILSTTISCSLYYEVYDKYNDCKNTSNYKTITFFLEGENLNFPVRTYIGKNQKDNLIDQARKIYEYRRDSISNDLSTKLDRQIFIHSIDSKWVEHLTIMDNMRQSIGLEAVGQRNPLIQYKKMGFDMFSLLMAQIKSQIVSDSIRVSNIQKSSSNRKYREEKSNFDETRKNMSIASNSTSSSSENLSRQDRRRLERMNRKKSKKRN